MPRRYSPDPSLFMSEVIITCADLPEGDTLAIEGGILAMGGSFSSKLTSQVTHIIALTMDNEKVEQVQDRNLGMRIVLPHWVDDCLRLGKKIDETPYLLPDPDILQTVSTKAPNGKINKYVAGASHPHPQEEFPQGPKLPQRAPVKVLKSKKIVLDADLGISQYLRGVLDGMALGSGGKIVENVNEAEILICRYRDGRNYRTASLMGIDVGNLAWLYYIIVHDVWTSPYRRLLHYPVARQGLPGFKDLKISLSNYSGEARTYLENLIKATGAECTKTLRQENTHLITAHQKSEKVAAAQDWNINIINHLWLEESYSKWQIQTISNPRYNHFPKQTNLGEVVGQTELDRAVLKRVFFPDHENVMNGTGLDHKQIDPKPKELEVTNARVNGRLPKQGADDSGSDRLRTPAAHRFSAMGKENVTPGTTGSRKSKDAATAKLHEMTPDIALYEKEKKRVGGVVYGGRRKTDDERTPSLRKRSVDAMDIDEDEERDAKKSKTGPTPISMHLLISGYNRWVGKAKEEDADTKLLRELGITVISDPAKATHIAVPRIMRTAKFLVAVAYAPEIISTDYIDACLKKNEALDPKKFKLKDTASEKKMGVSLDVSRERAQENQQRLLHGRQIYCVEKISGGFDTYQAIIEANGGTCVIYRGRHATIPSGRGGGEDGTEDDPQNEVYLLSSDSKEDSRLWTRFTQMAEGSRKRARIVRSDWLLDSAICQEVQPPEEYELSSI